MVLKGIDKGDITGLHQPKDTSLGRSADKAKTGLGIQLLLVGIGLLLFFVLTLLFFCRGTAALDGGRLR